MPSRPSKKSRAQVRNTERTPKARDQQKPASTTRHRGDAGNVSTRILGHVAATGRRMQAKRDAKPTTH